MEEQMELLINELSEEELAFFESLAPSYKKIFVNHAYGPKKEETRQKNLLEVKEAMRLECKNIFDYKKKKNPRPEVEASKLLSEVDQIDIYFKKIEDEQNRKMVTDLYNFIINIDDKLQPMYAWNQPMIKLNETFICAFSTAKAHFAIGLEGETREFFKERIEEHGYGLMLKGFKVKYNQEIDFDLIKEMILFTMEVKKDAKGFWK